MHPSPNSPVGKKRRLPPTRGEAAFQFLDRDPVSKGGSDHIEYAIVPGF